MIQNKGPSISEVGATWAVPGLCLPGRVGWGWGRPRARRLRAGAPGCLLICWDDWGAGHRNPLRPLWLHPYEGFKLLFVNSPKSHMDLLPHLFLQQNPVLTASRLSASMRVTHLRTFSPSGPSPPPAWLARELSLKAVCCESTARTQAGPLRSCTEELLWCHSKRGWLAWPVWLSG